MSSPNEVPLGIRLTESGTSDALQKLRQLHDELNRGTLSTRDYNKERREIDTRLKSNVQLWNESKNAIYATNPTLLEFSRTMSGFGQITAAATSGMTAINTAMLLLAGGSDAINQVKIKIAELTNQLDNLQSAGMGNTTQAQDLKNSISQLKTELGNLNQQFTGKQIETFLSFGAALGQMAVGAVSAGTSLKTLSTFMGTTKFAVPFGIAGTVAALVGVAVAALASGAILGEAFNPNKQAVADFRAQLDASFGDNPFTNYIILPLAAMIDELNGNKADWTADVKAMGDAWGNFTYQAKTDWINFENVIITGLNKVNEARNTIFGGLDALRGVASPKDMQLIPLPTQTNPNANAINQMLVGNPTPSTPEQNQQLKLTTDQNRILEQTKSFGQSLTNEIKSSTNPTLLRSDTSLNNIDLGVSNLIANGTAQNELAQQQLQATQEQKAAQTQLKDSLNSQIAQLKQTISDNINLPQTQLAATHYDPDTGQPIFDSTQTTTGGQKVTDAQNQLAQAQSIISGLDNATSGLAPVLQSIGLSGDTGIGSIISSALGGAAGIGGAGISAGELQKFAQTGDYGIFTNAAIADNTVTTPTKQTQIQDWLNSFPASMGLTTADAEKALGYVSSSSNITNIGAYTAGSTTGVAGIPGEYGVPASSQNIIGHGTAGLFDPNTSLFAAASGFEGMVSGPTHFLAGEAGPEFVHISPTGKDQGSVNIYVSINNQGSVIAQNDFDNSVQESLKQALKRAGFT